MNTAIVTGAAQGLGLVTARRLAAAGYRVVLTDLQDVAEQAAAIGAHAIGISGDVASEAFVEDMAARIAADFGGAQVLVNNAGISLIQPAEDTTLDQWQRMMAVNLQGPFLLCRAFGRQMLSAGKGSIVNVASVAGLGGVIHRAAYNTSKHGLVGLTRALAHELGPMGITVNCVAPASMRSSDDDPARIAQLNALYGHDKVPLGRSGTMDEISEAVVALCGPAWRYMTGQVIHINGGIFFGA